MTIVESGSISCRHSSVGGQVSAALEKVIGEIEREVRKEEKRG